MYYCVQLGWRFRFSEMSSRSIYSMWSVGRNPPFLTVHALHLHTNTSCSQKHGVVRGEKPTWVLEADEQHLEVSGRVDICFPTTSSALGVQAQASQLTSLGVEVSKRCYSLRNKRAFRLHSGPKIVRYRRRRSQHGGFIFGKTICLRCTRGFTLFSCFQPFHFIDLFGTRLLSLVMLRFAPSNRCI